MKKYFLIIGILALLSACGATSETKTESSPPAPAAPPAAAPAAENGETAKISMTANGFEPSELSIKAGTTVMFANDDTEVHWPASGIHPSHLLCAGFDSLGPILAGKSYSFTFTEAKTCPMHDHLNPSVKGTITVTPQ